MTNFIRPILTSVKHFVGFQASRKIIRRAVADGRPISLDIGAGDKPGANGWLTVDMTRNCDIFWDLRRGIPFPDQSVSRIYSSHFLEHLSFREGQQFLDECLRVLSDGGKFLVSVPNARLYIDAYVQGKELDRRFFFTYSPAFNNTTAIDFLNYTAYMGGEHKYMFDEENLIHLLRAKGMKNVRLRDFEPTLDPSGRRFESIYAAAEK